MRPASHWRLTATLATALLIGACADQTTPVPDQSGSPAAQPTVITPTGGGIVTVMHDDPDNDTVVVNSMVIIAQKDPSAAGTGNFDPFLRVQDSPIEEGFNTDFTPYPLDDKNPTRAIRLDEVPEVLFGIPPATMTAYREIHLDLNEADVGADQFLSLDTIQVYLVQGPNGPTVPTLPALKATGALVYDLDGGAYNWALNLHDLSQGSGRDDFRFLIPGSAFDGYGCDYDQGAGTDCNYYFVLYVVMGRNDAANATFEEWSVRKYPVLGAGKTAVAEWTGTYAWDISKSVTPSRWDLFKGDQGTSEYTLSVTKTAGPGLDFAVSGVITVSNPSDPRHEDITVLGVTDVVSGPPSPTPASVTGCTLPAVIPDGGTALTCSYSTPLASNATRVNTATIDWAVGTAGDYVYFRSTTTANVVFGDPTSTVYGTAKVTDPTLGIDQVFTGSGTITPKPTRTFACDADEGAHPNTASVYAFDDATLGPKLDEASASVTVACYDLVVTKTAVPLHGHRFTWTIDKSSSDPATLLLARGQTYSYPYSVVLTASAAVDQGWGVQGVITIRNPNTARAAPLTAVTDLVTPDIAATVNCPALSVPARSGGTDGQLACTYGPVTLPNGDARTNTATATLQNKAFTKDLVASNLGTTDFASPSVGFSFSGDPTSQTDECVDVTDSRYGALGTVCATESPKTYTYSVTIGPYPVCGPETFPNTASYVTNDTEGSGSDGWLVNITVPCEGGCTLTKGYWKTHSSLGPAPYDDTWALLASGANTPFFLSGQTWYQIFWTPPAGNAYYNLAGQYMAAKLNILNGADPTAANAAIGGAETLFGTWTPSAVAALRGNNATRQQFIGYAATLDQYNMGLVGPGHCSEDGPSMRAR